MVAPGALKLFPLLAALDQGELETLAAALRTLRVKKGASLIEAKDDQRSLMFVADGRVRVSLSGDGREVVLEYFAPGDFFGELALLTGAPRCADVSAAEDCMVYVLPEAEFERHLNRHPGLARALLRELALRLRKASARIGDLALLDVYRRVAGALKSLAEIKKIDGTAVYMIEKRPTHQELAALAGTSREMVTRALKELESSGHIASDGKRIQVLSLPV